MTTPDDSTLLLLLREALRSLERSLYVANDHVRESQRTMAAIRGYLQRLSEAPTPPAP